MIGPPVSRHCIGCTQAVAILDQICNRYDGSGSIAQRPAKHSGGAAAGDGGSGGQHRRLISLCEPESLLDSYGGDPFR